MTHARQLAIAFTLILAVGIATAQEPSLAQQAAAARAHSPSTQTTPTALGHIVQGDYYNEVLGFQIRHIRGWTSLSRGSMNVDEALGREALGLQAGINQSANRAFGMHDEEGNNVMVTIVPIPAGATPDPSALKSAMVKVLKAQIPNAEISDESLLLGDNMHRFAGLHATYTIANQEIFQSLQVVVVNGYAVSIATTSLSAEQLQSLLNQLRASLQWTQPSAQ